MRDTHNKTGNGSVTGEGAVGHSDHEWFRVATLLPEREWSDVRASLASVEWGDQQPYPVTIVDSVVAHGADQVLALTTSMNDLIVAPSPVAGPPIDVVAVRAPGSWRRHAPGTILIEYLSTMGRNTEIERPENEALPLFWRFMETEFGIHTLGLDQRS